MVASFLGLAPPDANAQGLGGVAHREKARRAAAAKEGKAADPAHQEKRKVFSEDDLARYGAERAEREAGGATQPPSADVGTVEGEASPSMDVGLRDGQRSNRAATRNERSDAASRAEGESLRQRLQDARERLARAKEALQEAEADAQRIGPGVPAGSSERLIREQAAEDKNARERALARARSGVTSAQATVDDIEREARFKAIRVN